MTKQEFQELFSHGPVLLDGATGSNLMKAGMPKGVCTEQWILEHPDILTDLQRAYVDAGSRIIYAPTFAANRISLAGHGLEQETARYNHSLTALSKKAAQGRAYIAGDLTTTGKTEIDYTELLAAYEEQMTCLADAGVDLFVAETMIGIDETMAAIDAAHSVSDLPIMCSMTVQADGSLFFGGSIFEAAPMLEELGADAIGINCSTGPDQLENIIQNLHSLISVPVIAKPNAGMPVINEKGIAVYDMTPEQFAKYMKRLVDLGALAIGGCCGTTPEFIRILAESMNL